MRDRKYLDLTGICLIFGTIPAHANSITFTGTGYNDGASLSASAMFEIIGNDLIITLSNTATDDNNGGGWDTSGNTLSGIFFDFAGNPVFTPVSATVAPGSELVQFNLCSTGQCASSTTNVGGEWYFSKDNETLLGEFGIASSGYIEGSNPNFNGPNLDGPAYTGNGINFGLISLDNTFNPNGGLADDPVIRNSVILALSGAEGLSVFDITNVSFQYGTSLSEPNISTDTGEAVPEPESVILLGSGIAGLLGWRYYRSKTRYNPASPS